MQKPASLSTITEVTTATSMLISTTRITTSSITTVTSTAAAPTTTIEDPYTSINATVIVNIPSNSSTANLTVLVIIVFITITVVVIIVIVFWKERKSKQCQKKFTIYIYSTIDEAKLQGITKNKPEVINSETNKEEPKSLKVPTQLQQARLLCKIIHIIPFLLNIQLKQLKDNLAYTISPEHQITIQAYAISFDTKQ